LCAGKYRQQLNAATILGQAKTFFQAEIDSACELTDFFRFNAFYAKELANSWQPESPNVRETRNSMRFRGLEGFVAGISPFNFTAIGGNLGASPAIMVRSFST
jgi:1-pyrroline-5-carboxylate dehydrogenase